LITVAETETLSSETIEALPDYGVFTINGTLVGFVKQLVDHILSLDNVVYEFGRIGEDIHKGFTFECDLSKEYVSEPLCLQRLEPQIFRPIMKIRIEGTCHFNVSEFPLRRGALGKTNVAWGKGTFLGKDAILVASQGEDGITKLTVSTDDFQLKADRNNNT
jgi:hypothetical protein